MGDDGRSTHLLGARRARAHVTYPVDGRNVRPDVVFDQGFRPRLCQAGGAKYTARRVPDAISFILTRAPARALAHGAMTRAHRARCARAVGVASLSPARSRARHRPGDMIRVAPAGTVELTARQTRDTTASCSFLPSWRRLPTCSQPALDPFGRSPSSVLWRDGAGRAVSGSGSRGHGCESCARARSRRDRADHGGGRSMGAAKSYPGV